MSSRRPPAGLGDRGRRLWRSVCGDFDLSDAELVVLLEACRTADLVDRLTSELADGALTIEGSKGQTVVNPLAGEVRQQRDLLARLISRLALPDEDEALVPSQFARRGAMARWYRPRRGA